MSTLVSARPSDSHNDLTSDLHHLKTLVRIITGLAIDIVDPDKTQCERTKHEINEVCDLLWIARDMVETIADNSDAVHKKALKEINAAKAKKSGGAS
ncbi:MAG: hypothetical protein JNK47_12905 [Mesorhizobium sp.]|nr:hypothetical protein [Mesorhizobium sp.]MBL8578119.1 hypothetical protein [Mesorhizobium sp.]